jgi:pimeloyl-ACP methyl ester carboxylesterase
MTLKTVGRRAWVTGTLAATFGLSRPARGEGSEPAPALDVVDLELDGDARLAKRARLLVPRSLGSAKSCARVLLLHGLGETRDPRLGLKAWSDLYGLREADARLHSPPLDAPAEGTAYLHDEHRKRLNADLSRERLPPLIYVCPVTPNPAATPPAKDTLDRYAEWIETVLMPAVTRRTKTDGHFGLNGCSLGGYVALELYLRRPALFHSFGGVQAAIGEHRAAGYAERIAAAFAKHGARPILLETSTADPYRRANEALSQRLSARGIPSDLVVLPGPHSQPWLRQVGTLAMVHWHARHCEG